MRITPRRDSSRSSARSSTRGICQTAHGYPKTASTLSLLGEVSLAQLRRTASNSYVTICAEMLEGQEETDLLNAWLNEFPLQAAVQTTGMELAIRYRHSSGPTGDVLAIVLKAIEADQWKRLKACPDCRWVFYDHSRNASKKWCGMYARGPEGRACGTIAKVRRHRARQKRVEQKEN